MGDTNWHELGSKWFYGPFTPPPNPRLQATGLPATDLINSADGPAPEA